MKKISRILGPLFLIGVVILAFREVVFNGLVPISTDILLGAYFPWLDYKWGYAVGVPVKNALLSDPFSAFIIQKQLVADLLSQGIWPLWNKYILAGTPLLAAYHTNPFFPANFLLLLPKFTGWSLFIFGSTLTSSLTMYLYLRGHVSGLIPKLVASIIFAFGTLMTTWLELGTAVWAMSTVPLIFYFFDQFFIYRKPLALPAISIFLSMLVFAGNVQITTYFFVLSLLYCIYLFFITKSPLVNLLFVVGSFFLAIGISSIQLLPTYDLFTLSIRGGEHFSSRFNFGLLSIPQLIRIWIPDFFGNPSTHNVWGNFEYHEYSPFLGALTLPLVLPLVFKKRSSITNFFLATFIICVLLVVSNPVSQLIFSLPLPLLTYSLASRLLFIVLFAVAFLIAIALDQLDSYYLKITSFFCLLIISISVLAIIVTQDEFRQIAIHNSLFPMVQITLLLVAIIIKMPKKFLLIFLILIITLDMTRYFRKYNPFVSPSLVFPATPALDFVTSQPGNFRVAREKTNLLPPNTWSYYHLESVEGYEPLRPLNYSRLFHLLENNSYLDSPGRFSELEDVSPKYLDALNVKYFFIVNKKQPTDIQQKLFNAGYKTVFTDKSVSVLENPNVSPRAYFVSSVTVVSSEQELAVNLENPKFEPTATAIIEEPLPAGSVLADPVFHTSQPAGSVLADVEYSGNQVIINTKKQDSGFLVLADTFDHGWKLTIDGISSKIYQVNGALRGVVVPPGTHRLVMTYLPDSFVLGVKITLISLLLLVILTIFVTVKHLLGLTLQAGPK